MNAISYCRISIKDQSDYSLPYQQRIIKQYCVNNNLTLLDTFTDDGESSYTFDRPDFNKLEAFIKKNKNVQYLICSDLDRFSRNLSEALMKIKEFHDKFGIKVLATSDSIDTDFSDPSAFMIRAFKFMMAEGELHRIRQRTRNGMLQGALNGRFLNKAPYGYINARDDKDMPVILKDEEKEYVIKMIFKEYNRGMDIEDIRKLALSYGFRLQGNSAIQRILSNPVYAGLIKVPAHKGKAETVIKGIHDPMVSEMDYYNAIERLKGKTFTIQKKEDVPLRGVLKCSCGKYMTAGRSKGKLSYYWYYYCQTHKQYFPAKKIHSQFNEILDLLSFSDERIQWFTEQLSEEISYHLTERGEIIAKTKKALRQVTEKITGIEERYLEGEINKATYVRVMNNNRNQRSLLEQRMTELEQDQNNYWQRLNDLLPKIHDIRSTYDELDVYRKQQFITLVFSSSLIYFGTTFRTPELHPMFAHNLRELKDKRLLEISSNNLIPVRTPIGNRTGKLDFLLKLCDLLAA